MKMKMENVFCIRAIQVHSGGMIILPRLMKYVMIPYRWKQIIYHVDQARDQYSKAEAGLVGRRKRTYLFNSDEAEADLITDQETKEITLANSLETKRRCSVLNPLVHSTRCWSKNFGRQFLRPLLHTSLCQKNAS